MRLNGDASRFRWIVFDSRMDRWIAEFMNAIDPEID
jgi:hypothetical protein